MTNRMLALTVRQPWAAQLVTGRKAIEWRSWPTTHRGPLLIHAGLAGTSDEHPLSRVTGAVIGQVLIVGCERRTIWTPDEAEWAWHIADPEAFPWPWPAQGKIGLFTLEL